MIMTLGDFLKTCMIYTEKVTEFLSAVRALKTSFRAIEVDVNICKPVFLNEKFKTRRKIFFSNSRLKVVGGKK